jgi:protein HIRA/HIR1
MVMILKPAWVTCDGRALMSIDIHPDGDRFAVGGQGVDCGRVSIWNMKPILDSAAAKNKDVPKLLTQMDHHEGCVNCVRWSHDGRFLASAGDDKLVRYPIEVYINKHPPDVTLLNLFYPFFSLICSEITFNGNVTGSNKWLSALFEN